MSEQRKNLFETRRDVMPGYLALRNANLYHLIVEYVTKFQEQSLKKNNFKQLINLMENKGVWYNTNELKYIVELEFHLQRYPYFRDNMQYVPVDPREKLIEYFVLRYRTEYKKFIPLLECYLYDLGYPTSILEFEVERIKKRIDAEKFERDLSYWSAGPVTMKWIDLMTGHEFQDFLRNFFLAMGNREAVSKKTRDFGGDIIVTHPDGSRTAIQAKRSINPVGVKAVQEAYSAVAKYGTSDGWVVTNSYFTRDAEDLAVSTGIRLVNRDVLNAWVLQYQMIFMQQGPWWPPTPM